MTLNIDQLQSVAVLGAGTMGHGIAQVVAIAGWNVRLFDVSEEATSAAVKRIQSNLEKGVARGKVDADSVAPTMAKIQTFTDLEEALTGVELAIEAVPERMDLKRPLFETMGRVCPPNAILASNTSSFSIAELATASGRPKQVVGMHFFNPVHIMKLLEVIVAEETSEEVATFALAFSERLGKQAIRVKDFPGFATSRLGITLGMEAIRMLEEGVASAEDIDAAMTLGYRHPIGPLRLTDLVGLDVRLAITRYLHEELKSEVFSPPPLLVKMVEEGRLGRKSGRGFYEYEEKS